MIFYCLENLPSTLMLIYLLERWNSLLIRSKILCMMLNKLKNIFVTASKRAGPFWLVIWCSFWPRTSYYQAYANCNHSLWDPFKRHFQDLVLIAWIFYQAWLLFVHGSIPVSLNQLGLNMLGHLHWQMTPLKLKPSFKLTSMEHMLKWNWMGYASSHNQWIWLFEPPDTAFEVVKTFLRGKEQERVSL